MLNPQIFREYDIRGRVGTDLDPQTVTAIARALATHLLRDGLRAVVVGHDNRLSSEPFKDLVCEGFLRSGLDVTDIGLSVTPMMYFSRLYLGIPGGTMVTGSHNPPEYNGFKVTGKEGALFGEDIRELYSLASGGRFESGLGESKKADVKSAYFEAITKRTRLGSKTLRVVLDCGNGTASSFAPCLLSALGAEVIPLYCESDGEFPNHFPDPANPENLKDLRRAVLDEKADLGISLDGDADRLGVIDDTGSIIWGDVLMALFWREIMPKYPGAHAIVEVKCSQTLVDEITRLGGTPSFYKTGHSLIKARMKEVGSVFTGEMSGHMFFNDEYYGFDDALYASARLLRLLSNSDLSLSAMTHSLSKYISTPEIRVDCPDGVKFAIVDEVKASLKKRYEVIEIDGARVYAHGGWGLIRASNTQPVLVLRCEAGNESALLSLKRLLETELARFAEVSPIIW